MARIQKDTRLKVIQDLSADVQKYLKRRSLLKAYDLQEKILQTLVKEHADHTSYEAVDLKAKLLNMFYSTGIQAMNKVVERIMSIKDIDEIFHEEKYSKKLINTIAQLNLSDGSTRNNYSFATKYCALHQPEKYPIYDSIVAAIFVTLFEKGGMPPYTLKKNKKFESTETCMSKVEFANKLRDYDFFVQVYDCFMDNYGLSGKFDYRKVDWYLWGSYKDGEIETKIEILTKLDKSKYVPSKPKEIKKSIKIKD
jgi:hypothetical protein